MKVLNHLTLNLYHYIKLTFIKKKSHFFLVGTLVYTLES